MAGIALRDIDQVIHGTTLATNALIERRGARTALVTTEGFRDVIEMRTENRFEQYDLNIVLPAPLSRAPTASRCVSASMPQGKVLRAADEAEIAALAERLAAGGYESIAIGFIHAYANGAHERAVRAALLSAHARRRRLHLVGSVAADARIRALQHGLRQRLRQAADQDVSRTAAIGAEGVRASAARSS